MFEAHIRTQGVGTAALGLAMLVESCNGAHAFPAKNGVAPIFGHGAVWCIVPSVGVWRRPDITLADARLGILIAPRRRIRRCEKGAIQGVPTGPIGHVRILGILAAVCARHATGMCLASVALDIVAAVAAFELVVVLVPRIVIARGGNVIGKEHHRHSKVAEAAPPVTKAGTPPGRQWRRAGRRRWWRRGRQWRRGRGWRRRRRRG